MSRSSFWSLGQKQVVPVNVGNAPGADSQTHSERGPVPKHWCPGDLTHVPPTAWEGTPDPL